MAANGDIFVAQGHTPGASGDPRILKFDKTGKFLTQWGGHGKEPGKFEVAHSIAFDAQGQLWFRLDKRHLDSALRTSTGEIPAGPYLLLIVQDDGAGMTDEARLRAFEPFFSTKSHGTGLGLAIVERIAEAHGGDCLAQNCPDGGAAFTLRIPHHKLSMEAAA